ncbi:phosphatase PAP2 family protein [Enterococcus faecium]|uniref:PAP2 family protein n=1 Tax=Enterococcus faecium SD2A-2 TaxID=1244154 RepID=A0AB73A815_ENTFC|nr:phosphatase PAP2 family protein [Enterococcus faecium]EPI10732.1 PAP2 family protein [Enterococcus faecium SD2A-2]
MLRLIAKIDDSIINKFAKQRKTDSRKINFLKFISNISNGGFIWLLLAAVLVLIPDTREYGLAILIGSLIYFFVGLLFIKKTTRRKRPYEKNRRLVLYTSKPKTSSFPSRHTALAFLSVAALFELSPVAGILAFLFACLIAYSRIFLLLHYPTDILGGAILGSVIGILCAAVI